MYLKEKERTERTLVWIGLRMYESIGIVFRVRVTLGLGARARNKLMMEVKGE